MNSAIVFLDKDYDGYLKSSSKTKIIRFKQDTFNTIVTAFNNFRRSVETNLETFEKKLNITIPVVDIKSVLSKQDAEKSPVVARLEEKINFLKSEELPNGNWLHRAIKLKDKMMRNLRKNTENVVTMIDKGGKKVELDKDKIREQIEKAINELDNSDEVEVKPISPTEVEEATGRPSNEDNNYENEDVENIPVSKSGKPANIDMYEEVDKSIPLPTPVDKIDFNLTGINGQKKDLNNNLDIIQENRFLFDYDLPKQSSVSELSSNIDEEQSLEEINELMERIAELKVQQAEARQAASESQVQVSESWEKIKNGKNQLLDYMASLQSDVEQTKNQTEANLSQLQYNRSYLANMLGIIENDENSTDRAKHR